MLELEMGEDVAVLLSKHLLMYGKFYQIQMHSISIFPFSQLSCGFRSYFVCFKMFPMMRFLFLR